MCSTFVSAESFLKATSFPKTFDDVPFVEQMQILKEGYEVFESEYDNNGVCIKNCAYVGITIEEDIALTKHNTEIAVKEAIEYEQNTQANNTNNQIISAPITASYDIPTGEPVKNLPRISSPFGPRIHPVKGVQQAHKGIDYAVASDTPVYTTANGTVVRVFSDNSCGNGITIEHAVGIKTIYCHLQESLVKEGDNVSFGQQIALSGNTGCSTGPHLHYGMKNKNNEFIDPSEFTHRAK